MQKPPSIRRAKDYPVTVGLGLLSIVCTALSWLTDLDMSRLACDPALAIEEPWRLLTSTFLHADPIHLAFNLYWLWVLGVIVEQAFGHLRTAFLYAVFAVGSALAEMAIFEGGIGLSGVGYGLVAFVGMLAWRDARYEGAIDGQTVLLFVVWFFVCIAATYTGTWRIANVAHGAGAVLGALFGWAATSQTNVRRAAAAAIVATLALFAAGATALRPSINLGSPADAREGYVALEEDRNEDAREALLRAVERDPDDAGSWVNLGIAHQRLGEDVEARRAFERACRLDSTFCEGVSSGP